MKFTITIHVRLDPAEDRDLIERITRCRASRVAKRIGTRTQRIHAWINGEYGVDIDTAVKAIAVLDELGPWESQDPRYQSKRAWHRRQA